MESVYSQLTGRARELYRNINHNNSSRPTRVLIALAGPPGSGKSTVAAEVVKRLNADSQGVPYAIILPMDGFHLTRATLDTLPNSEEARARRGIWWTYNPERVVELVMALYESRENIVKIHSAPGFDHATKDPIEDAIKIDSASRLVILEGNWLLYDQEPWSRISSLVDETWFIDVDPSLALQRIARRHLEAGIEETWEEAIHRAESNDILNGVLVRTKLVPPAVSVESVEELGSKE